jgi:hypothetical protein
MTRPENKPAEPTAPAHPFDLHNDLHGTDRRPAFEERAPIDLPIPGDSDESGDVEHQLAELPDDVIERFEQHGGE